MSLLMDALKRVEKEKKKSAGSLSEESSSDETGEPKAGSRSPR
jgi:hypothetical protein